MVIQDESRRFSQALKGFAFFTARFKKHWVKKEVWFGFFPPHSLPYDTNENNLCRCIFLAAHQGKFGDDYFWSALAYALFVGVFIVGEFTRKGYFLAF